MIWMAAVSYFGSQRIDHLVESLASQGHDEWRLVVVDNSGSQSELQALNHAATADHRVSILAAPENLGYLGGARLALRDVRLGEDDWFIVANTDLVLDDEHALEVLDGVRNPAVGVVAPRIVDARTGQDSNPYWVQRPTTRSLTKARLAFSTVASARLAVLVAVATNRRRRRCTSSLGGTIYAPHGSFMAFSQRYFGAGGTLDFPQFLFGEELFVGESCRAHGVKVLYMPKMRVRHFGHDSTGVWRSKNVLTHQMKAVRYSYDVVARGASYEG